MISRINSPYQIGRLNQIAKRKMPSGGVIPTDIPNCLLWWDFADIDTLFTDDGSTKVATDGDLIHRVNDKSGNNNHGRNATEGYRPTYKTAVQNGKSVARFSEDNLDFATRLTNIRTVYLVFSDTNTDGGNRFILGDNSTYNWHRAYKGYYADPVTGLAAYADAHLNFAHEYFRNAAVHRNTVSVSAIINSPLPTIHISVITTTGNMQANNFQGDRNGTNRLWKGDLAELILYSGAHDDATRQSLEAYANEKWAIY